MTMVKSPIPGVCAAAFTVGFPKTRSANHVTARFLSVGGQDSEECVFVFAVYSAFSMAQDTVKSTESYDVPLHIRNAPTSLMREMGHGEDYRYAHNFDDAFVAGESYFPKALDVTEYYHPVPRGLEIQIGEKLAHLRRLNAESEFQRYEKRKLKDD